MSNFIKEEIFARFVVLFLGLAIGITGFISPKRALVGLQNMSRSL